MYSTKKQQKGFTLIELLVVIAIIGLLASIILASLNSARIKGRDARRIADMKDIQTALELYASDHNGSYPTTTQGLAALAPSDIATVPTDPGSFSYTYAAAATPTQYCLEARLEGSAPVGASASCTNGVVGTVPTGSGSGTVYYVNN